MNIISTRVRLFLYTLLLERTNKNELSQNDNVARTVCGTVTGPAGRHASTVTPRSRQLNPAAALMSKTNYGVYPAKSIRVHSTPKKAKEGAAIQVDMGNCDSDG